jgi:hypothetical protein
MSKTDAGLMAKIKNLSVNDAIIDTKTNYFEKLGLTFSDFLYLNDIGILSGVTGLGLHKAFDTRDYTKNGIPGRALLLAIGPYGLFLSTANKELKTVGFKVYAISQPAAQLLRLATPNVEIGYLREIAINAKAEGLENAKFGPLKMGSDGSTHVTPDELIDIEV